MLTWSLINLTKSSFSFENKNNLTEKYQGTHQCATIQVLYWDVIFSCADTPNIYIMLNIVKNK